MVHVRSHIMGLLCCAHPAFCKVLKHTLRHDGWGSCRRCLAFLYACQQAAHMPLLCCAHPAFCKVVKHTLRDNGWGSCRRCLAFICMPVSSSHAAADLSRSSSPERCRPC
jgi:hypothetical protein